ncbi:MAG TPA: FAD-binding oxidoreductase [Nostocaceae cyanobacterium]|nr:FAD-binding oxidoreductase [Nostocaceae cyanobacterium]
MKTYECIVIGGGITGTALAYQLVKSGFSTLLLEKYVKPQNATHYSYGGLAYWLATTPLTRQLCQEAIALYQVLPLELDADIQLREIDLLLTIAADDDPKAVAAAYADIATVPQLLDVQAACELEPLLNKNAIAGALTVKHGHINPEKTAEAYIQAMQRLGGKIEVAQVLELSALNNSTLTGVKTENTTFLSENIIICAGGLSRQLLKSAGINLKIYFTHAEAIETPPVDIRLNTLVTAANLHRFKLEAESTQNDQLWDQPNHELVPPILDAGAIQFLDGSLRLGQISRVLTDPYAQVNAEESEKWLRESVSKILPILGNLPGKWYHCLVAFSADRLPLIGSIPGYQGIHIFSGFNSPLVLVPPLAARFANFLSGQEDAIISQLSPHRGN